MTKITQRTERPAAIKTPQQLVHIKHKISLRQYKYWLLMLRSYQESYEAGHGPNEKGFYRIPISTISDWMGYTPNRVQMREDLRALRREEIIYNVLNKDGKAVMRGIGFISEWEMSANWVGFKLPDFLRESIEQLEIRGSIFQALNWRVFNGFTGKYEAILYKLCRDYVGVRRTPVMSLEAFREYMGLKSTEYPQFKDLNKFIISQPVERINDSEVSDIIVEVVFTRAARKIVTVQFLVTPKSQTISDLGDDPAFRFAQVPVSLTQQRKYLSERTSEEIISSIARANEYAAEQVAKGKSVNVGGLYRTAIEADWGKDFEAKKALLTKKSVQAEKKIQITHEKRLADVKQQDGQNVAMECLWKTFLGLPEEKKGELIEIGIGDNKFVRNSFKRLGAESPLLRTKIISLVRDMVAQKEVSGPNASTNIAAIVFVGK